MGVGVIALVAANASADVMDGLERLLASIGHQTVVFATSAAFLGSLAASAPDIAVTADVGLVRGVRAGSVARDLPILLLTPDLDDDGLVAGLRAGADDHLSPGARAPVLLARVGALLRRTAGWARRAAAPIDGVDFDEEAHAMVIDGERRALTAKEFKLAQVMFRNSHRALTRGYLIDAVWGPTMDPGSRALDTHMSRLKSKLGPTAGRRFEFEPIYGYGYRLKPAGRAPVAARQA